MPLGYFDHALPKVITWVKRSGDTMKGILTLKQDPVNALDAATKQYVDNAIAGVVSGGGTFDPNDSSATKGTLGSCQRNNTAAAPGTVVTGNYVSPTVTGTATLTNGTSGLYTNYASTAVANNAVGWAGAANCNWTIDQKPIMWTLIRTGSPITVIRHWIALCNSTIITVSTPIATQQLAGFRYATDVDGTAFWRTVTSDGTTVNTTTTTSAIAANTVYLLKIDCRTTAGSVIFSVNGSVVATHAANIPLTTVLLSPFVQMATLENVAKNIGIERQTIISQ
jgi:hypothetical protein